MTFYKIEDSDLDELYKTNKNIKELHIILSNFLNKKKYISSRNNIRQHKINLILSMSDSDIYMIIYIWLFIIAIVIVYILSIKI